MYIFLGVVASTRRFYMLFALLVFCTGVVCIVDIRSEIWSFFYPVLPYDTSYYDYCSLNDEDVADNRNDIVAGRVAGAGHL